MEEKCMTSDEFNSLRKGDKVIFVGGDGVNFKSAKMTINKTYSVRAIGAMHLHVVDDRRKVVSLLFSFFKIP